MALIMLLYVNYFPNHRTQRPTRPRIVNGRREKSESRVPEREATARPKLGRGPGGGNGEFEGNGAAGLRQARPAAGHGNARTPPGRSIDASSEGCRQKPPGCACTAGGPSPRAVSPQPFHFSASASASASTSSSCFRIPHRRRRRPRGSAPRTTDRYSGRPSACSSSSSWSSWMSSASWS